MYKNRDRKKIDNEKVKKDRNRARGINRNN